MIDKKQQITDMAEIMYEEFVKMKKSLDGFEEMSLYNTDKHYLTDEYKEGFIAGIKCLSSILFFL